MASSTHRSIIAALETTFTPPAACFSSLEAYTDRNTALLVPLGITASPAAYYSCFPPGYGAFLASNPGDVQGAFYSPGICPSGFTSACTVTSDSIAGESAALCCPSHYGCFSGATGVYTGLSCFSTIVSTTVVTHYTPNFSVAGWQSDGMVTLPTDGTSVALGYGIEVRWKSSDLSVFAGATRTGITSATPISTGSGMTSSTSISSDAATTSAPGSGGMSSGTKIALGLGIPIVVILLGLITAALLLIRRKKRARNSRDNKRSYPELDGDPITPPAELQGEGEMIPPKVELNARTPSPVEIDGTRVPSPVFQLLRRPAPVGGDSGYGSSQGSRHRYQLESQGRRVSDTYTISPVGPGGVGSTVSAPPASHPATRRARSQSEHGNSPVSTEDSAAQQRTSSRTSSAASGPPSAYPATRENRHRRSASGNRRASDAQNVSPVGSSTTSSNPVSRTPSIVRRSSTDPPPVPPIPSGHRRGRSASGNRRGSDARTTSSLEHASGPVSSPPSSVRRPSTDDRSSIHPTPSVLRRPVPPSGTGASEVSSRASDEEREIAERYRMFTVFGPDK